MYLLKKINKDNKNFIYFGKNWIGFHGKYGVLYKYLKKDIIKWHNQFYEYSKKNIILKAQDLKLLYKWYNHSNLGTSIKVRLLGVGYRFEIPVVLKNSVEVQLKLGFSHECLIKLPKGMVFKNIKNRSSVWMLSHIDYKILQQTGFNLRKLRKPEPYKGKGLRFHYEQIKRKEGKKTNL